MGKLVVSLDGVVIKQVELTKDKTTLGRRPYNDIVIDNLAVSGEHAVLQTVGSAVFIEDLNSTNGTYINGRAIRRQQLAHNDSVEIGKYKLRYLAHEGSEYEPTQALRPPPGNAFTHTAPLLGGDPAGNAAAELPMATLKVLNGHAAGHEAALTKIVTTVGKPGVQVASITRRPSGYVLTHVEGSHRPSVNGAPLQSDVVALRDGDVIELAGTQMLFALQQ
ncbi:FHA domain-containing protein [Azohydromonas caseinilytica]|uniref:FHA domain-containing protein n=1 Tax=Azohydromonas caseinilytica TaxID=2728836 RepID=A0A848FC41_9BURK|nr:FHA domain-containing protein [Azohydromonas caseinilytica]NML16315.1 FHA domain-containing protein [Azohydromonas caseinilytica]